MAKPGRPTSRSEFDGRISAELVELMFDCTSDGVFAIDSEMRIMAFNRAAEISLGVSRDQVIGKQCRQVIRSNICHESCAMTCTLESGDPVVNLPVVLLDARDRRIPATLSSAALKDRTGRVIGSVGTFRDLTRVKELLRTVEPDHPFANIVSDDRHMTHIFDILPTIAGSESSVLVHGETGTGKNLIARAIHNLSPRAKHPFITISCGALPETLLESELFGYRAGAFTDAVRDHKGRIALAEKGTLFLDEIGEMSPGMQVKLLRFLQDHVYERLGDNRTITADVRVLAATNKGLVQLVEQGRFRRDLFYRINVLDIELPPLRERRRDIPLLAHYFLERLTRHRGKPLTDFSRATLDILMKYDYPGNIRELENIIEHAYVLCPGPIIEPEHLPEHFHGKTENPLGATPRLFADLEGQFILDVLARHHWNRQETARDLGIHKTTLARKIRKLDLRLPKTDGRSHRKPKE